MAKVALITGGTRGIGLGIARKLVEEGYDLALNGMRSEDEVHHVLREFEMRGIRVIYIQGDISFQKSRNKIIKTIEKKFGELNVLINNAGVAPKNRMDILECTEESYDQVMNINLRGTFFLTQQVSKWMLKQKMYNENYNGCIINISSISASVASINRPEYCISKAGLSMTTKLFAVRMGEYEIPVYEIRPGVINTDMTSGALNKYKNLVENGNIFPQRRIGNPEEVGKAVAALVRKDFPYSTGNVFMVDGGFTIEKL